MIKKFNVCNHLIRWCSQLEFSNAKKNYLNDILYTGRPRTDDFPHIYCKWVCSNIAALRWPQRRKINLNYFLSPSTCYRIINFWTPKKRLMQAPTYGAKKLTSKMKTEPEVVKKKINISIHMSAKWLTLVMIISPLRRSWIKNIIVEDERKKIKKIRYNKIFMNVSEGGGGWIFQTNWKIDFSFISYSYIIFDPSVWIAAPYNTHSMSQSQNFQKYEYNYRLLKWKFTKNGAEK